MMVNEPLDGKVKLIKYIDYLKTKDNSKYPMWFANNGFLKKDVKSACEFYLKYYNKPDDLMRYLIEKDSQLVEEFKEIFEETSLSVPYEELKDGYNIWLFKLAFKDVMEDASNES